MPILFELYHRGELSLEEIVAKTSHNVSIIYKIKERGFIREGYYADLVLVDLNKKWEATTENILYQCGWSPLTNYTFKSSIVSTFVNGHRVYSEGTFNENYKGKRLLFDKER